MQGLGCLHAPPRSQSLQSRACCAWSAQVSGVASLPDNGSRVRLYRRVAMKRVTMARVADRQDHMTLAFIGPCGPSGR